MSQNWNIDPKSGDYVISGGAPEQTDSLKIPAYIRLKTRRLQWLYAPDDDFGSDFHNIKRNRSSQDPTLVENTAARALQPIVDDGRSSQIDVETTFSNRHNVAIDTRITDARGEVEEITFEGLGI